MKHCPYCFEEISEDQCRKCPHCLQFIIDPLADLSYKVFEKKKCILCGKKVLKEARYCKYCHRWLDRIDQDADEFEQRD